jgi:hypothetical protein
MLTANLTVAALAARLAMPWWHTRQLGDAIIAITGPVGSIGEDLYVYLNHAALSDEARLCARELIDSGVLAADAAGDLMVRCLPRAEIEIRSFHSMLGTHNHA